MLNYTILFNLNVIYIMATPIFYNIQVNNTSGILQPLQFNVDLSRPLMSKPSDYSVSVVRFKLPNYNTPLFTFVDGRYIMKLSYNGTSVSLPVVYIPQNSVANSRAVYEIQGFIEMLNTTINSLYTALNLLTTLPTVSQPFFTYNEETELISVTAIKQYYETGITLPVQLEVNQALYQMISGLPTYYTVASDLFLIWFKDYHDNTVTISGAAYLKMTQQNSSIPQIIDFGGIVLTSNMPLANEYTGINYVNPVTTTSGLQESLFPILQDFVPSDLDMKMFWQNLVYNSIVPYRQVRIKSDTPFMTIHIDSFILNNEGTLRRIMLPPNGSASVKLMFTSNERNKYA